METINMIFFYLSLLLMLGFGIYLFVSSEGGIAKIRCPICSTLNLCTQEYCDECGNEIQDY